jgi:prepilin peptidase CpaA
MVQILPLHVCVVLVAVLVSAVTDLWKFKVHNALTLPLLACGLIYHAVAPGPVGFASSVVGALFGFSAVIGFYVLGGMGGGDVKLMTAVGAWLGFWPTLSVFIAASLASGIYAVVVMVLYRTQRDTWVNLQIAWHRMAAFSRRLGSDELVEAEVARDDRRGRIIPFAAMITVGLLASLIWIWLGIQP